MAVPTRSVLPPVVLHSFKTDVRFRILKLSFYYLSSSKI